MFVSEAKPGLTVLSGHVTGWNMFLLICLVLIVAYVIYRLIMRYNRKKYAKMISQEDFQRTMAKAQVIDVREAQEFESAHITGARNIPYSQAKQGIPGLSKTSPIYLYDNGINVATRMAKLLAKEGYENIYILEYGFDEWQGKTKRQA